MNTLERTFDVITGDSNMEDLHTLKHFPVFMGCVEQARDQDICSELTWQINKTSGFLQLKKLVPLDILYQAQHDSGVIGRIWMEHHQSFANFLDKSDPSSVLELGGAHGILAVKYNQIKKIPWTIVEPNPIPIKGCKAKFVKGFFDESFEYVNDFDTVVHSHVFEHIYKPNEFMRHLSKYMKLGQKLVFSLPNMEVMLEKKYTNCLNFEHTVFLTEPYVEYLLACNGFKLLRKEYFMDDHSIFYSAERAAEVIPITLQPDLYKKNKSLYMSYVNYHETLIADLNKKMRNISQPIYLFGAHVFAQFLIEMGLNTEKIVCIIDNDPKKHGKRLYGSALNVESPKVLKDVVNPIVILRAGVYNNEIKKDILVNINKLTTFLE